MRTIHDDEQGEARVVSAEVVEQLAALCDAAERLVASFDAADWFDGEGSAFQAVPAGAVEPAEVTELRALLADPRLPDFRRKAREGS